MSETILVTGAAGFIGFHMARRLLADGWIVHGLDNLNDYYDPRLKQARLAAMHHAAVARCDSLPLSQIRMDRLSGASSILSSRASQPMDQSNRGALAPTSFFNFASRRMRRSR